jgi:isopenicillin N synthase-like dioxygenase
MQGRRNAQGEYHGEVQQAGGHLHEAASQAVKGAEVGRDVQLSCGEHTDYGLLTLVNQEPHISALQVAEIHWKSCRRSVETVSILQVTSASHESDAAGFNEVIDVHKLPVLGLQVKNARGEWITAKPIPGSIVCNIGDMLKVFTDGMYEPTPHRVINADPSRSRVSIPFFYEPAFEAQVRLPVQRGQSDHKSSALPMTHSHGVIA